MTQYKLIAREPTEEMLDAQYADAGVGRDLARKCFVQMFDAATDRTSELQDHLDLMVDEFRRISAISFQNLEVKGLCERAITNTVQKVPLIARAEQFERELFQAIAERDKAQAELAQVRDWILANAPLNRRERSESPS